MAFYDLIGERPQGYLEDNQERRDLQNRLSDTVMNAPASTLQSETPKEEAVEALMLQRAGFIQDPRGMSPDGRQAYVDPRLLSSQATMSLINDQQEYLRQRTLQKASNPLFKVADTVADTGRLFLSPLFWLKGEDMTRYDPSAMLESGYRTRMSQLDALRIKSYDNYFDAKTQRMNQLTVLQQQAFENADTLYQRRLPQDTYSKELLSEAQRLGGDTFTGYAAGNAESIQAVQDSLALNKGQATSISGGRIVRDNALNPVRQLGKDFKAKQQQTYGQALEGYDRLIASLNSPGGLGDVAAIFGFMKMLDPNSVVRESEYATAANAGGIYNRMMNLLEEAEGNVLPDNVRAQMRELATDLIEVYGKAYGDFYDDAVNSAAFYDWFNPETDSEAFFGRRLSFPTDPPPAPPPLLDPNSVNRAPAPGSPGASGADIFNVDLDLLR